MAGMWHEKRKELALKLREQKAEYVSSRITFQHERSEKAKRMNNTAAKPACKEERPRPPPRMHAPAENRTFVGMCNQRDTAPASVPWPEYHAPSPILPRGPGPGKQKPGYRPSDGAGYGATVMGNAKWHGPVNKDLHVYDQSSAPRGFPLRQAGGGAKPLQETEGMGNRRWIEQATKASLQENGREQLDRLLMERVAKLSESPTNPPSPPRAKAVKAQKMAKKKDAA